MIFFILYSVTNATAPISLALILSCSGIHPPLCFQGSSRVKVLECKSEVIILLLKIFHWGTCLQDTLESLRVACKPPYFYFGTCLSWPHLPLCAGRLNNSQFPKAPGQCVLLGMLSSFWHFSASSFLCILPDSPQHHLPLKTSLDTELFSLPPPELAPLLSTFMSWRLFVYSMELTLLGCELLVGSSYFLLWDLWHLQGTGHFNQWVSLDWLLIPKFFCVLSVWLWMSLLTSLYFSRNNNNMSITRIKWEIIAMRNQCTTTKRAPALFN